jgi:MoxR-like ATPase
MANLSSRETVTIAQAKAILRCMADRQSVLLLAGPGVGKSDCVYQAAADAKLPCRSLVGTQIAPEDVSGIPRIVGERSVFCPPRVLLPEEPTPFCLFLDELPACSPDIQKAFYSLLLERRIGEHPLPPGTWVVAAGNRVEDRSLVRALSSALVNRVILLHVRVDFDEWMTWAHGQKLRAEVLGYLQANPDSLARHVPAKPGPFSTPRAWASLARALDRVESAGHLTPALRIALAAGRVSPEDAADYCLFAERQRVGTRPLSELPSPHREAFAQHGLATFGDLLEPGRLAVTSSAAQLGVFDPDGGGKKKKRPTKKTTIELPTPPLDAKALEAALDAVKLPRTWIDKFERGWNIRVPQPIAAPILLSEAKALLRCLADGESLLLQAAPGVGKTAIVAEAALEAGLPCRSLLGTQIAPEDVSGIPRIVGERSVFCPPRVLLPEDPGPFCLFLDELPACSPDVQKAFYPLLLERRLGEHALPTGSWVVAAGNRVEDRALVREMSAAMVNRLFLLSIRVDAAEWFAWAERNAIRQEVVLFLRTVPEALLRPVPAEPVPFSTPRAWAMLADSLDRAAHSGILDRGVRRALAFGRISAEDAAMFCAITEQSIANLQPIAHYVEHPEDLPKTEAARWFLINRIRKLVESGNLKVDGPGTVDRFLRALSQDHRLMLLVDLVKPWADLGAEDAMFDTLVDVTGISR